MPGIGKDRRQYLWNIWGKSWIRLLIVAAVAAVAVAAVHKFAHLTVPESASTVGAIAAASAFLLAYQTLRATHEWNRRHYTIEMAARWNKEARPHLDFLEKQYPLFFAVPDFVKNRDAISSWKMDADEARRLLDTSRPDVLAHETRNHLIALFNCCENFALAYEQYVVDRAAIENCFGQVISDAYTFFQPFVVEIRKLNRSDPWPPLSRVVLLWLSAARLDQAHLEARARTKEFKDRIDALQVREPTDS
jgi:hypothetical protein